MSKQVELKFKKLVKNAEFVHADLEYHQELLPEAKHEFFKVVNDIYQSLSPEDRKKIDDFRAEKMQKALDAQTKELEEVGEEETEEELALEKTEDISASEEEEEEAAEETEEGPVKKKAIKLLYRKIAAQTHPDKSEAKKLSSKYTARRIAHFKRAQKAYKEKNWFVLYQIAIDLGIAVPQPSKETLEWIEEDIKATEDVIKDIGTLVVWVHYAGGDLEKEQALRSYFLQSFGYELGQIKFS